MTHLINHTPYYFCKCTCVVQNIHTSLALRSTFWRVLMYIYQSWLRCVLLPSRAIYVQPLLKMYTKQLLEWVWVWFVLFYDTSSQKGYSVPSTTILFLNLQITRSDIRPDIKWAVSLVIAYGLFNLSLSTTFFAICRPLWNPLVFALWSSLTKTCLKQLLAHSNFEEIIKTGSLT